MSLPEGELVDRAQATRECGSRTSLGRGETGNEFPPPSSLWPSLTRASESLYSPRRVGEGVWTVDTAAPSPRRLKGEGLGVPAVKFRRTTGSARWSARNRPLGRGQVFVRRTLLSSIFCVELPQTIHLRIRGGGGAPGRRFGVRTTAGCVAGFRDVLFPNRFGFWGRTVGAPSGYSRSCLGVVRLVFNQS